jgi:hypothetical protein
LFIVLQTWLYAVVTTYEERCVTFKVHTLWIRRDTYVGRL